MSSDIPDWVRTACRRWGKQKRRIWTGRDWYVDSKGARRYDIDGYANSLLGRIRDERDGASQGQRKQYWAEVFWGDGLDVQRSIVGMPERQFYALHFQYVFDPEFALTIDRKAQFLSLKRTEYFALVDRAETWVYSRLDSSGRPDAQVVEQVEKIIREALQTSPRSVIKLQTRQSCPPKELNFSALKRKTLSLV